MQVISSKLDKKVGTINAKKHVYSSNLNIS